MILATVCIRFVFQCLHSLIRLSTWPCYGKQQQSSILKLFLCLQDGLIHKDEFILGLFKTGNRGSNVLVDKMFQRFDIKKNDVIDFEEFVHSLSVFHPRAGLDEKAKCALLYGSCIGCYSNIYLLPGPRSLPLERSLSWQLTRGIIAFQEVLLPLF